MRPLAAACTLACLLSTAAACGPAEDDAAGTRLPLGIDIRGLTADQVGQVQVAVLARALGYSCPALRSTCLRSRVLKADGTPIDDLVPLKDAQGAEHNALRFEVDSAKLLSSAGQTFEVRMPPGQNYLVVAEVLSKDDPAMLLASGCSSVLTSVGAGQNAAVEVQAWALDSPAECQAEID